MEAFTVAAGVFFRACTPSGRCLRLTHNRQRQRLVGKCEKTLSLSANDGFWECHSLLRIEAASSSEFLKRVRRVATLNSGD
jgi:hypothetical protein